MSRNVIIPLYTVVCTFKANTILIELLYIINCNTEPDIFELKAAIINQIIAIDK